MKRKTLQELTIKDNFMFAAAMLDSDNCRAVLECILGFPISEVKVCQEKSIVYHPEYKGIRLDVLASDEKNTHFNVEMQVANQEIRKRARYYHSQIDMELLLSGYEYEALPDCYVIFICDFDPVGLGKYRYTMQKTFREDTTYSYQDGSYTIFLSTKGKDEKKTPKELISFLRFVGAELSESQNDFSDALVSRLQMSIARIKKDREMGERYMLFEEMMRNEFKAGKAEGLLLGVKTALCSVLSKKGEVSDSLSKQLNSIADISVLNSLLELALEVPNVKAFEEEISQRALF